MTLTICNGSQFNCVAQMRPAVKAMTDCVQGQLSGKVTYSAIFISLSLSLTP
jgi:hypothetical protein